MLVQIVLFDGFDLLDALAPYEVFGAAEMFSGGAIRAELVTAEGARAVPSGMNGPQIAAGGGIDLERAGIILIPGASGEGLNSVPFILKKASETSLIDQVRDGLSKPGLIVATVCGGSLLLAMAGLLEGRRAVTNQLGMDVLGATGAIPVNARVVDDGDLVTGGGVTSGLDVALYLIERELGPQIAIEVEKLFEYERRGTIWHARGIVPVGEDAAAAAAKPAHATLHDGPADDCTKGTIEGVWLAVISTPLGKQRVTLRISGENGHIRGTATQGDETVDFIDPVVQGNRLSWSQRVTKPMRLNLKFEVTVRGNEMTGIAKAGMLPASKLTGERVATYGE